MLISSLSAVELMKHTSLLSVSGIGPSLLTVADRCGNLTPVGLVGVDMARRRGEPEWWD